MERSNIDAAVAWGHIHDPLLALRIVNGFGWAWSVVGGGADAAQRVRDALTAAGSAARVSVRATALLIAGWLEASGGDLDRATADLEHAMEIANDEQRSVATLYLAFIRSQQNRAQDALQLLAVCRSDFQRRHRTWEEGASWLLTAWAEIALGEMAPGAAACQRALSLLGPLGDQWALNHAEGMLGGLALAEHRFPDAIGHLQRAAEATRALGFAAAEAHHLANLGRAQAAGGDNDAAIATLERAMSTAHATGDLRTKALASVRLGRVLRSVGRRQEARRAVDSGRRWYAAAGGGEAAVLADYLLAALDADDGEPAAAELLRDALDAARRAHDVEVEVLALDALARTHAEHGRLADAETLLVAAEAVMSTAGHLFADTDRIDNQRTRSLLRRR